MGRELGGWIGEHVVVGLGGCGFYWRTTTDPGERAAAAGPVGEKAVFVAAQEVSPAQLFPIYRLDNLSFPYLFPSCLRMRKGVRLGCACVCEIKSRKTSCGNEETISETTTLLDIRVSDRA